MTKRKGQGKPQRVSWNASEACRNITRMQNALLLRWVKRKSASQLYHLKCQRVHVRGNWRLIERRINFTYHDFVQNITAPQRNLSTESNYFNWDFKFEELQLKTYEPNVFSKRGSFTSYRVSISWSAYDLKIQSLCWEFLYHNNVLFVEIRIRLLDYLYQRRAI